MKNNLLIVILLPLLLCFCYRSKAQEAVFVNLAMVDGIDITPDNIFNFQIHSNLKNSTKALIKGAITFRKSDLRIHYSFHHTLKPGANMFSASLINPRFQYSSNALKELFEQYKILPQGIYEYCVMVQPEYQLNESNGTVFSECVYHKSEDIFLINLVDPENDSKIYEYNPMLTWIVNYPFANQLTYRTRVTEIKEGQNTVAAITRNNPVYDEKNLMQMSIVYPPYAKPLQKFQPYAWTVDAYYKGILLGGAMPWRFTIVEDSLLVPVAANQSYFEFAEHYGETAINAIDTIKLKYRNYKVNDTLRLTISDKAGKEVKLKNSQYPLQSGTNYLAVPIPGNTTLSHKKEYILFVETSEKQKFTVPFVYLNPLYIKNSKN